MKQLEKQIGEAMYRENFQISLRNAGVFWFPTAYRFKTHNHREIEINYINNGSCIIGSGTEFVPLKAGDCIVINAGVPHHFIVDTRENCRITQLEFRLKMPEELSKLFPILAEKGGYHKFSNCESTEKYMENLCRLYREERPEAEKETMLHLGFFQLFIELSEKLREKKHQETVGKKAGKIADIIRFINENCSNEINIEELAKRYGVSSRYIRKCFQQETGMSCQKYITTLRIGKAKELLWFTQKSMTEIAMEAGFGSSQYFCRVFGQYMGMTPLEYRNQWKGEKAKEEII